MTSFDVFALSNEEISAMLKQEFQKANGLSRWCRLMGVSPGVASRVANGKLNPTPSVLRALGLRRVSGLYAKQAT